MGQRTLEALDPIGLAAHGNAGIDGPETSHLFWTEKSDVLPCEFPVNGRFIIDHVGNVTTSAKELHDLFAFPGQLRPSRFRCRVLF
jgi:hypothetical protein